MTRLTTILAAGALLGLATAPLSAAAQQSGGWLNRVLGGQGNAASTPAPSTTMSVTATAADSFLSGATQSSGTVMSSAMVLAQMLTNPDGLAARGDAIEAVQDADEIATLNARRGDFTRSMNVLNGRGDLAGDLQEAYADATPDQQRATRTALGNLATGLAQNAALARQAPSLLAGIGGQGVGGQGAGGGSQLLGRLGLLRTAASLLGLQANSLGSIGSLLPGLFSAVGMAAPANPGSAAPVDLRL